MNVSPAIMHRIKTLLAANGQPAEIIEIQRESQAKKRVAKRKALKADVRARRKALREANTLPAKRHVRDLYVPTKERAYCEVCKRVVIQPCLVCLLKEQPKGGFQGVHPGSLDLDLTEEQHDRRAEARAETLRIKEDQPYEEPLLEKAL